MSRQHNKPDSAQMQRRRHSGFARSASRSLEIWAKLTVLFGRTSPADVQSHTPTDLEGVGPLAVLRRQHHHGVRALHGALQRGTHMHGLLRAVPAFKADGTRLQVCNRASMIPSRAHRQTTTFCRLCLARAQQGKIVTRLGTSSPRQAVLYVQHTRAQLLHRYTSGPATHLGRGEWAARLVREGLARNDDGLLAHHTRSPAVEAWVCA